MIQINQYTHMLLAPATPNTWGPWLCYTAMCLCVYVYVFVYGYYYRTSLMSGWLYCDYQWCVKTMPTLSYSVFSRVTLHALPDYFNTHVFMCVWVCWWVCACMCVRVCHLSTYIYHKKKFLIIFGLTCPKERKHDGPYAHHNKWAERLPLKSCTTIIILI